MLLEMYEKVLFRVTTKPPKRNPMATELYHGTVLPDK